MDLLDPLRRWFPGPGPGRAGDPGLFSPGSIARRVNAESALLLGGGRALLLQLAHPLVAAGVADHSDFRSDPFGRLVNTLNLTLTVAFGDHSQRRAAAARVAQTHRRVVGERNGSPYRALDPELLLWVHATLVDSAIVTYERFVGPLGPIARERYHDEMKRQGAAFGVTDDRFHPTYDAFRRSVDETVASLVVTDEARELGRAVLHPPAPPTLRPFAPAMRLITTGLLPEPVREGYGLAWGPRDDRLLAIVAGTIRPTLPFLPDALRRWPHARDADRRLADPGSRRRAADPTYGSSSALGPS
jgi:uncharacterized protein (DUF2236 family)